MNVCCMPVTFVITMSNKPQGSESRAGLLFTLRCYSLASPPTGQLSLHSMMPCVAKKSLDLTWFPHSGGQVRMAGIPDSQDSALVVDLGSLIVGSAQVDWLGPGIKS